MLNHMKVNYNFKRRVQKKVLFFQKILVLKKFVLFYEFDLFQYVEELKYCLAIFKEIIKNLTEIKKITDLDQAKMNEERALEISLKKEINSFVNSFQRVLPKSKQFYVYFR
jgi:hypothetical protein